MDLQQYNELKASVKRIESGLFGDEQLGHVGIVGTQQNHERRLGRLEKAAIYIAGGGGFAGVVWTIWSQWPRK